MIVRATVSVLVAGALVACQKPTGLEPVEPAGETGHITIGAADQQLRRSLADASCRQISRGGRRFLSVRVPTTRRWRDPDGHIRQPDHLTATLPDPADVAEGISFEPAADTPFQAIASVFDVTFAGADHEMLQFLARKMPGNDLQATCRFQKDGPDATLTCKNARPFPWRGPGEAPGVRFEAQFRCASSSE